MQPLKINLGSGDKHWPGWCNVDTDPSADVVSDVRTLPMESDSAAEIHGIHIFEHLDRMEAPEALKEWLRVLTPGGKLVLEMPCFEKIMDLYAAGERNLGIIQFGLFGDPRERAPAMLHKWCWGKEELRIELITAGFESIAFQEPKFHVARRDMRVIATKGL